MDPIHVLSVLDSPPTAIDACSPVEMPIISQLRHDLDLASSSMPPLTLPSRQGSHLGSASPQRQRAGPGSAYFRAPSELAEPRSLLEALDYCIRGMQLALLYRDSDVAQMNGKQVVSAKVAAHYINRVLAWQLSAADNDECSTDLLLRSTDLLHKMYAYACCAARCKSPDSAALGLQGKQSAQSKPSMQNTRNIKAAVTELQGMIPKFRESIRLKEICRQDQQDSLFIERYPVYGMFPMTVDDL